jgi:putative membrane protein
MRKLTYIIMLSAAALIVQSCAGSRSAAGNGSSSNDDTRLGGDGNIVGSSNTPGTFRTGSYGQSSLAITATPNTTGPSLSPEELADNNGAPGARSFIIEVVQCTMSEVRLSKLAISRSKNESIKNYAAGIAEDRNGIDNGLQSLALSKKISLTELINADQLNHKIDELNNTRDDQFDKQYLKMIIREHQNAVDIFKKGTRSIDPAIRSYAGKYLPVVKIHLKNAGSLKPVTIK